MARHNESALKIAQFLHEHPAVEHVNYPGLPDHPDYKRAQELFDGFSGMLSIELKGGLETAKRFMDRVELPVVAPSLGGIETLVTRPATTSHSGMLSDEREAVGITDSLVRVSIGIEDVDDLISDFDQALS
jgi:cystathionine beta-lyase/cystathionine gamma-synthase